MYVLKEPNEYSFQKVGISGKLWPMTQLVKSTSFLLIETEKGHETTIREKESDFIYYVLEGKGEFIVNGAHEPCVKGDLVVIPRGNAFTYKGTMRLLLSCTPPWTEKQEETL